MLGLPESLRQLVARKFVQARTSQDLIFSETQLSILENSPRPAIQLRYCPALGKKPTKDSSTPKEKPLKPFDPFENPSPELLIAAIPSESPTHNLVLNKYPVIHNHFILATKDNKPQTGLLEKDDLYLAYSCIKAWKQEGQHSLFAFFNSGEHSGASQPHRHLQFLPVEELADEQASNWQLLCTTATTRINANLPLLHNRCLPVVHLATRLQESMNADEIHQQYLQLMRAALASISDGIDLDSLDAVTISQDGRATFSYNLAVTEDLMAILPRKNEAASIPGLSGSSVAINGTILAGTMMVKAEEEWNTICRQPQLLQSMLSQIAYWRNEHSLDGE